MGLRGLAWRDMVFLRKLRHGKGRPGERKVVKRLGHCYCRDLDDEVASVNVAPN
jgi:hypothetical protein